LIVGKGNRNRKNREENPRSYNFSSTERKLVDEMIRQQIRQQEHRLSMEVDAAWLWQLYEVFGWPEEELHRIYKGVEKYHQDIRKHYLLDDGDGAGWLYLQKLRDHGIDLGKWYAE
jgi:hypothetical protein